VRVHALNFGTSLKTVGLRVHALNFGSARKNVFMHVSALNFGVARKNVGVRLRELNFGSTQKNVGARLCAQNFGTARKTIGVQVCMLNLALHSVNTHNNGACGVHSIGRAQWSLVGVRECGYMLSHDSLVNGMHRVLVHGGSIIKFGMEHPVK
jgi:hypothetical protein